MTLSFINIQEKAAGTELQCGSSLSAGIILIELLYFRSGCILQTWRREHVSAPASGPGGFADDVVPLGPAGAQVFTAHGVDR